MTGRELIRQVSIYDVIAESEPEKEIHLPKIPGDRVYTIPDDVWESRCRICIHRNAEENAPIPISIVHKPYYEKMIPCRIMSIARIRSTTCTGFARHAGTATASLTDSAGRQTTRSSAECTTGRTTAATNASGTIGAGIV